MAKFQVSGPDGAKYELDAPDESSALSAFQQFSGAAPAAPAEAAPAPIGDTRAGMVSNLRGVPVAGAYADKAAAYLNAVPGLAAPDSGMSTAPNFLDRAAENEKKITAATDAYEKAHPVETGVGKFAVGTMAFGGPAMASAKLAAAMGMTGKLLPAMRNAALTGAAVEGADSAARGGDVGKGAITGALTGAGGVAGGKIIGAAWNGARRMFTPNPPPAPMRVIDVNGRPVPISEGRATSDPALQAEEEIMRQGNKGKEAQDIVKAHDEARQAGMTGAHEDLTAALDPNGPPPGGLVTPHDAAATVADELAQKELGRQGGEDAVRAQVLTQGQELRSGLSPDNAVVADTPYTAAGQISQSVRGAAQRDAQARTAAYDAMSAREGEFSPAVFQKAGAAIRNDLNQGADAVRVSDRVTPATAEGLHVIDEQLGQLRFENQAQRGQMTIGPDGRPQPRPITPSDVEQVRKQLVILRRQANSAARMPGGSYEDARGMGRLMDAFDQHVERAVSAGGFSGDGAAYLAEIQRARALHAQYRQTFSQQNPQDEAGKAMEAMIGKYPGTAADPDKAAQHLFGAQGEPGGQGPNRTAARVRDIFGEQSPEWAAYRQGLLSHTVDTPAGADAMSHAKVAGRIEKLMMGGKGQSLARTAFTEPERNAALAHARNLRTLEQTEPQTKVDKIIASWSGRDGSPQATMGDIVKHITSGGPENELLIGRLKQELSPASFNKIKQGMLTSMVTKPEGVTAWGDRQIANNLANFLNGKGKPAAEAIYSVRERELLDNLRKAHELMAPLPGTTNPSGSAHMGARIVSGTMRTLLPLIGLSHGGIPGAAAVLGVDAATRAVAGKVNAGKAVKAFYGAQPSRALPPPPAPQALGAIILPSLQNRQSPNR